MHVRDGLSHAGVFIADDMIRRDARAGLFVFAGRSEASRYRGRRCTDTPLCSHPEGGGCRGVGVVCTYRGTFDVQRRSYPRANMAPVEVFFVVLWRMERKGCTGARALIRFCQDPNILIRSIGSGIRTAE